jgi:hypothetical protein
MFSTESVVSSLSGSFGNNNIKSVEPQTNLGAGETEKDSLIVLSQPTIPEPKDEIIEVALDNTEQIVARLLANKKRDILQEKEPEGFNDSVMKLV